MQLSSCRVTARRHGVPAGPEDNAGRPQHHSHPDSCLSRHLHVSSAADSSAAGMHAITAATAAPCTTCKPNTSPRRHLLPCQFTHVMSLHTYDTHMRKCSARCWRTEAMLTADSNWYPQRLLTATFVTLTPAAMLCAGSVWAWRHSSGGPLQTTTAGG